MKKYISVGFTKKPHGLKGELKVQIEDAYLDDFLETTVILLEIKGKHIPFFITEARAGNDILMKLEEVDSKETAFDLVGKELFMREQDLLPVEEEVIRDFTQFVDYQIEDTELGAIGIIEEVVEYPQQMIAVLTYKDREVLIPLHQAFIRNVQHDKKKLQMELPEGLLDL